MPRRDDLHKILILGSGPIVIGQAAEFDYSGAQACKVLLEEGYEVVLVNSNPATIMTDPEFATRTYVEPLLPETGAPGDRARAPRRAAADARRPDRAQPRQGAARGRHARRVRRRADRRDLRGDLPRRGPRGVRRDDAGGRPAHRAQHDRHRPAAGARRAARVRPAADHPPGVHARRPRRRHRPHRDRVRQDRRARARRVADRPGADRRVGARVGRVRARGHARPRGQRGDRLLDRERRPDGRAHRRQRHRRAAADADRPPVPAAARPGDRGYPRGRGRDRRLQRPVRGQPGDRGDRRHRDEPAGVALLGAGLEGDGLPDRQDRRTTRGRLPARRDPQRHHAPDAGELRADDRLRGRQVAALRVREVPRRRRGALDPHEVGRRGDGDRPHVPAGVREGDALTRARHRGQGRRRSPGAARDPRGRSLRRRAGGVPPGRDRGGGPRAHRDRPVVPARASRAGDRPRAPVRAASARSRRSTPAPPSSPPRRPTTTRPGSARRPTRSVAATSRA